MINNLFSVFDPCTGIISINWLRTFIFIILTPYKFWINQNKIRYMLRIITNVLNKEISILIKYKGTNLIIISLFILILFNNLIGLAPYVFTSSSHLTFSLSMAIPMWMALILFGWINKTNSMFSHLVPNGTPGILIPFIVLIETVRNIIRPGSLAVRLTANIIAGHLIISLLGRDLSLKMIIAILAVFIILMLFEFAVAIIQSYVFVTLINLYSREI